MFSKSNCKERKSLGQTIEIEGEVVEVLEVVVTTLKTKNSAPTESFLIEYNREPQIQKRRKRQMRKSFKLKQSKIWTGLSKLVHRRTIERKY